LVLASGLTGCINNKNVASNENKEKILGRWTATIPNTPLIVTMNFVTNISHYESMNKTLIWGSYSETDKTITLQSNGATKATTLEYTFSNNNTTLTLFNTNGAGIYLVMTRQ